MGSLIEICGQEIEEFLLFPFQKCLDKDPSRRWSCDRLLTHSYFEDYVKRQKEFEASLAAAAAATAAASSSTDPHQLHREKTKVSEICTIL